MSSDRTSDLAILLGHALQCEPCRDRLLTEPDRVVIGRKISNEQRALLAQLSPEDFENTTSLAAAVGMDLSELREGLNHPRARMRHF
ncbi:MAG: hypothetical protein H6649_04710 [Caldilineae bacterium]|nr:hypothetical protein [Anaerolineae bacterium]MCB0203549.1 hypothetical protein [Anaerolineae bacterium]MCB0254467.1 hypothetical protein [Anaerolineae bacterium]MCB9153341.1 hypothetical protein [Caldilineae bacterium]